MASNIPVNSAKSYSQAARKQCRHSDPTKCRHANVNNPNSFTTQTGIFFNERKTEENEKILISSSQQEEPPGQPPVNVPTEQPNEPDHGRYEQPLDHGPSEQSPDHRPSKQPPDHGHFEQPPIHRTPEQQPNEQLSDHGPSEQPSDHGPEQPSNHGPSEQPPDHVPYEQPPDHGLSEQPPNHGPSDQPPDNSGYAEQSPNHEPTEHVEQPPDHRSSEQPLDPGPEQPSNHVPDAGARAADGRLKWGQFQGVEMIRAELETVHARITTWKNNFFQMPRNSTGKDAIRECTRLLQYFNNKTAWEPLAMHFLIVFLPLMLQRPAKNSKNSQNVQYLKKRLALWKEGRLHEIVSECEEIQKRLQAGSSKQKKEESAMRGFSRLMMLGKVRQALKLIDADSEVTGVHEMSDEIRAVLQEKHPEAEPAQQHVLDEREIPAVEPVIFEEIDASMVCKAAEQTSGSGGPTRLDADAWKHIICSRVFGKVSEDFANAIAMSARRMCRENITHSYLSLLWECRLVPLMKEDDGVRPVGIGEPLRRIIGKCVLKVVGGDVQMAAGALQTCAGVDSGVEAAIHAMADTFNSVDCEAVLLVDAENAFNRINREVSLHNIQRICPSIHTYLNNCYKEPSRLHLGDGTFIYSKEGATQGDNLAMAMYSLSTRKPIEELKTAAPETVQAWFADDSADAGKLAHIKVWWEKLKEIGPPNGYYPNAPKTILILKSPELRERAEELFSGEGIKITSEGKRHIGAVLGSQEFKEAYVQNKVEKWTSDVHEISKIANEEPQAALSAFNTGLSQRWKFLQRTVSGTAHMFQVLEDAIREEFIPAICGRGVSDVERRMLAMPYRYGGMGILNPTQTAQLEYDTSRAVTADLAELIRRQELSLESLDHNKINEAKAEMKRQKEDKLKQEFESIQETIDDKSRRLLQAAQEKGASAWLSALPIKRLGYVLNKQEFRDAVALRYGWKISDMPRHCGCSKPNSIDHVMTCKRGGYVSMRHNALRNTEAAIMREVCKDVAIEPGLIPTVAEMTRNAEDGARLDIAARGVWSTYERTFFDVVVAYPNANSHVRKSMKALYEEKERLKKRKYNDRVINVEKATFTPLVFTTTGGMGPECEKLNKRLAELISLKTKESYNQIIRHLRTRLRFALLKSTLVAIRGVRGPSVGAVEDEDEIGDISFNLIPSRQAYEP